MCHYRLDLTGFNRRNTAGYFRVNEFFARRLAQLIRPDDVIWIHDYHFIPLASYLRQLGFANRIGFFLHIPWAPPDLASVLPAYDLMMRGFAAYDLVGFQTPLDAENFGNAVTRGGLGRLTADGCYEAFGRRFRVGVFPIGIDTPAFRQMAEAADRNALVRRMAKSLEGKHLIIGVDRLDYSKGLAQRIERVLVLPRERRVVPQPRHLPADHAEIALRGARVRPDAARPRGADRAHQRSFRRRRLDADPLHQQADRPHGACRPVPSRARRPRDAAPRRHEPRRQGVRGGAVAATIRACSCCRALPAPPTSSTRR